MNLTLALTKMADYSSYGYDNGAGVAGFLAVVYLVFFAVLIVMIVAQWKIFVKAGEPGWYSIIPILNTYTLFKIIYGSGWKMLLTLIPFVGSIISLIAMCRLGQAFGKGIGFNIVFMLLLSPIGLCILGFSPNVDYRGYIQSII